jgi:release factor glutamine methyltransferase
MKKKTEAAFIRPRNFVEARILSHLTDIDYNELLIKGYFEKNNQILKRFEALKEKVKKGYPLDYIIGKIEFAGKSFSLEKGVLIPREETEEWVQNLISKINKNPEKYSDMILIDLGCGSGVIGISLASYFKRVYLVDNDPKALEATKRNIKRLGQENCYCIEGDIEEYYSLLSKISEAEKDNSVNQEFLLVANLPYVPSTDRKNNVENKVKYEPEKAIYSGKNGLYLFDKLFVQLFSQYNYFKKPFYAQVWFELDPRNIEEARESLKKIYPITRIIHDSNGRKRVLAGLSN